MKNNARYTAQEIVSATSFGQVEGSPEVWGNLLVNIGGIGGIVDANKIIFISADSKTLDVFIGTQNYIVELEDNKGEPFESEAVKEVRENQKIKEV